MKKIVRKAYWNFEKEENWLNEMAANGLALVDYSWCRYVFESCEPGEYIYRLELLEHSPANPESAQYIAFMEDNGVECVASYQRWVYFRKKAADGSFDIYSDIDSRIAHYRRIQRFWLILACVELTIGITNIHIWISPSHIADTSLFNGIAGSTLVVIGLVLFATLVLPVSRKISKLKKEKLLRE